MTPIRTALSRRSREAVTHWQMLRCRVLERLDDCPFGYEDWDFAADLIEHADKNPRPA